MADVVIEQGDLTEAAVDAIVNAANETLLGGGGVDGAIHRAAGPQLLEACRRIPQGSPGVRCPTGEARITPGFDLPAAYVIHTVGPRYSQPDAARLLASAFRNSLSLASSHDDIRSLAFPAVSCGVYGYPADGAAAIAAAVVAETAWDLDEIRFVLFSLSVHEAFAGAFA